jgi:hypothetical protein
MRIYLVGTGVIVLKNVQKSIAMMLIMCEQGIQEILELKYISMKDSDRSEQNIIAQRHIDQMNVDSIRKTVVRNYVNSYPPQYMHSIEFTNWKELEQFVDVLVKNNKKGF